ncbi:MAG: S-layer protein, partial [Gemmatimonadota bacterium]
IAQVRARLGATAPKTVLGAGLGAFLACAAARRTGLAHHALADRLGEAASRAMPAVAVARLLQDASG